MIDNIPNNQICFLLLPGFNQSVVPVLHIKHKLEEMGYSATAANFWGTEGVCDFSKISVAECQSGIASLIADLSKKYKVVIGIGISLGGALLLEHAKSFEGLDYIVSIGTPFKLKNKKLIAFGFAIYPIAHLLWQAANALRLNPIPVPAGRMAIDYLEGDFLLGLEKIKTPTLFIQSNDDFVTDPSVLEEFSNKISSPIKKVIYLDNTNHVINYDNDLIVENLIDFMKGLQ